MSLLVISCVYFSEGIRLSDTFNVLVILSTACQIPIHENYEICNIC